MALQKNALQKITALQKALQKENPALQESWAIALVAGLKRSIRLLQGSGKGGSQERAAVRAKEKRPGEFILRAPRV